MALLCFIHNYISFAISFIVASRNCSLAAVLKLLIVLASLISEHGLYSVWASVLVVHKLSCPHHVGSSSTRNWTCVPCIGRRVLNYWTTRKVTICTSSLFPSISTWLKRIFVCIIHLELSIYTLFCCLFYGWRLLSGLDLSQEIQKSKL